MFAIPPNGYNTIDENLDGKRHCILIASSNPYPYARLISRPNIDGCGKSQLYANAQTVAQWFGQCSVSLSVICPRNLPKIRALYEVAKRNPKSEDPLVQVPGPDYLVLISEDFKEALSALAATIPAPCQNALNRASPAPCQNSLDPTSQVPNQDAMDPTNPSEADLNPQDALEPRKLASSQDTLHPVRPASAHDALNSASPAAAQEAVAPLHPEFGASTSHRPDSIPTNKTLNLSSLQAPSLPVLPQDLFWNIKNIQCTDTDSVESMLDTIFECDICFSKSLETTTTTTTTQKQSSSNLPETSHTILGQAIALEDTLLNMPPKSKMKFACSNSSRGFEATTHTSKVLKGTSSTKDMIPLLSQTQTSSHLPETTHNLLELLTASPKSGVGEQPNDPNYFAPSVEVIASQKGLANAQYVMLWEGDLRVQKSGKSVAIFELEAYRMKSASERLAEDWPYSIRIACLMPLQKLNHKYDGSRAVVLIFKVMTSNRFPKLLKEKGLGAIVDLPNQTLILTVSDDTTRLIGSLFPKVPQTRRYRRRKH